MRYNIDNLFAQMRDSNKIPGGTAGLLAKAYFDLKAERDALKAKLEGIAPEPVDPGPAEEADDAAEPEESQEDAGETEDGDDPQPGSDSSAEDSGEETEDAGDEDQADDSDDAGDEEEPVIF